MIGCDRGYGDLPSRIGGASNLGFGNRGLLEMGLFRKVHALEILENLEILEILETSRL